MSTVQQAAGAVSDPRALSVESPHGRPTGEWGMFLFVATEATFFATLLACYFYVRFTTGGPWPPGELEDPKLVKPLVMTALLLLSSGPMIVADHAIRHGRPGRTAAMMPLTLLLGGAFLALQIGEYGEKLAEFTPRTDAYGSLFYVITGFHGAHVAVGLVMIAVTEVAALKGKFTRGRHERIRMVSIYWHFVDVVWIAILASLYLSPHLRG
jgi:heme/copper-type cytochrome/quinol oxidase subunit 3